MGATTPPGGGGVETGRVEMGRAGAGWPLCCRRYLQRAEFGRGPRWGWVGGDGAGSAMREKDNMQGRNCHMESGARQQEQSNSETESTGREMERERERER